MMMAIAIIIIIITIIIIIIIIICCPGFCLVRGGCSNSTLCKDAAAANSQAGVSVAPCRDGITNVLTIVSEARGKDAANASFLAGISVARCKDAARANFMACVPVVCHRTQLPQFFWQAFLWSVATTKLPQFVCQAHACPFRQRPTHRKDQSLGMGIV